jgi:8-hydroxy-5-deazaflavin:NADPH oxidoreductase
MRIGILGSGIVGQTLGTGFARVGHDVRIGSKSPQKPELVRWKESAPGKVSTGTFADAVEHGELVVLAFLGAASDDVLRLAGPSHFEGKLVIDATNALDFSHGMPPGLFVGLTDSLGERHQRALPRSRVVKCFNIVPAPLMIRPDLHGTPPTMMIAGDDAGAKKQVDQLLRELGWTGSLDIGGIESARWLEALVPLWVRVATQLGNFETGFRVVP